jgi:Beta-propeller repeat.
VISYASYIGGSGNDGVASIKVDATGSLYMAGFTTSGNFPVRGASQTAYAGTNSALLQAQFGDAFVAKLNPTGTAMVYATYLGGTGDDFATSLAIDASGNAYVTGATQSANFPTTAGAFQKIYKGFSDDNGFFDPGDGFVAKLNASGNSLLYATYLGGSLNDLPLGISIDSKSDAVVVRHYEFQ